MQRIHSHVDITDREHIFFLLKLDDKKYFVRHNYKVVVKWKINFVFRRIGQAAVC